MDKNIQFCAARVGVDLSKRVIQVRAVDAHGRALTNRALARDKFLPWCAQLPAGCLVVMEVSSSAHHWARKLIAMGLDARIISAQLAAPYRAEGHSGKNDANDAAAICEAAGRPHMRFVPVKSIEQQSLLCVHRLREGFKAERTACVNRIRGLLLEFGIATRNDPISRWVLALKERSGWQKAVVALANKNARILWAVMTRGERFDPHHISIKPGTAMPA